MLGVSEIQVWFDNIWHHDNTIMTPAMFYIPEDYLLKEAFTLDDFTSKIAQDH